MPAGSWTEGECLTGGHKLAYVRTGGNLSAVVLLHGFTEDCSTWFELAGSLEYDYDLIMPDMLGHGKSDRLSTGSPPILVQDLADLLAGLGLQKFALLGHSLGALTAAQLAAQYPERTACLILEDIPWFEPTALPAIPQDAYSAANPTIIAQLASGDLAQALAYCTQHFPRWNESARRAWAESKLHFDTTWFKQSPQQQSDWREMSARFNFPALLISGENKLGSLISAGFAQTALKTIPHLEWARVPGAGHYIHYDAPGPFFSTVKTFLRMQYPSKKG
jgi:Predicted hydrolases or acyltransferases (alpha/beta hydrolase superfamily)